VGTTSITITSLYKQLQTVRRVNNRCGPQQMELRPNYELELNKLMGSRDGQSDPSKEMRKSLPNSRLQAIESYMGLSTDNEENIFTRIKKVENRMLQLESISPEYRHFVGSQHISISLLAL